MARAPDFSALDTVSACDKGMEIELQHPVTHKGLGIFWGLLGRDSQVFRDQIRQNIDEATRRAAYARKRGKEDVPDTADRQEQRGIELLAVCSTGWRHGDKTTFPFQKQGTAMEELPFTTENVKRVLTELPEVRRQIDEAMADLENFMII